MDWWLCILTVLDVTNFVLSVGGCMGFEMPAGQESCVNAPVRGKGNRMTGISHGDFPCPEADPTLKENLVLTI